MAVVRLLPPKALLRSIVSRDSWKLHQPAHDVRHTCGVSHPPEAAHQQSNAEETAQRGTYGTCDLPPTSAAMHFAKT
jgi:hypothetical protein